MNDDDRPLIEQMAVAYATEIERLRSALEDIANYDCHWDKGISRSEFARKALANEERE